MKNTIMGLLSSGVDTPSVMRFAFLFSVIFSNIIVWYTWLIVCIWTRSLVNIPPGVVEAYGFANGAAFVGKSLQSFAERPKYHTGTDENPYSPIQKNNPMGKSNIEVF